MKRAFLILGLASVAGAANAVLIVGVSQVATESFDTLTPTAQTGWFSFSPGVQNVCSGSTFDGVKLSGSGNTNMNLAADAGGSNTAAIYSFGVSAPPNPSSERALGTIASGTNIAGIGVEIRNNSGLAWTQLRITFTQENWRSSTSVVNTTTASWSTSALASNYLSAAGGFTAVSALNLVGPAPVTTNGPLDGNLAANQVARAETLIFGVPVASGSSVFVRWQDANDAGNDAGLAIDNFGVQATAVPEPATMAVLGLGAAALLRRRRK